MPDVRTILAALDPQDRVIWSQHRTEMRRSYLNAHNTTVGMVRWDHNDDAFLDLMDIRLALLFDRAGRFDAVEEVASQADAKEIEDVLHEAGDKLKIGVQKDNFEKEVDSAVSSATKMMQNGWARQQELIPLN